MATANGSTLDNPRRSRYPKCMSDETAKGTQWGHQPGETAYAYAGFCAYLELGTRRSIRLAIEKLGLEATSGRQRNWENWSSKNRWRERAEAFDCDILDRKMAGRKLQLERVRQESFDEAGDIRRELRQLSTGHMRPGQQMIQTDRDGKPRTTLIEGPDGRPLEVAITKELVPPKVRADILIKLLGYAGIVEPVKGQLDIGLPGAGDGLRAALRSLDPELLVRLADALRGGSGDND